jgi:hypothetical protein
MAWILLLLAIGCFLVTFVTKSFAFGVLCMLLALVLVIAGTMLLLSARIGDTTRKPAILSPEELRALREQAQAQRDSAAKAGTADIAGTGASAADAGHPSGTQPQQQQKPPTFT